MAVVTYEAVGENGQIQLAPAVALPDRWRLELALNEMGRALLKLDRTWMASMVRGAAERQDGPDELCDQATEPLDAIMVLGAA